MQFRLIIMLFLFLLTHLACNQKYSKETQTKITQDERLHVIIPYQDNLGIPFIDVQSTTLSNLELIELEKILERVVLENNEAERERLLVQNKSNPTNKWLNTGFELSLKDKKRQYVAVINQVGEKEIWVNLFCDDFGDNHWKTDILSVEDGGNCFFNVKINLTLKTYSELMINGYA